MSELYTWDVAVHPFRFRVPRSRHELSTICSPRVWGKCLLHSRCGSNDSDSRGSIRRKHAVSMRAGSGVSAAALMSASPLSPTPR